MTAISQAVLVNADLAVQGMSADQRVKLADEIFLQQPNLIRYYLARWRLWLVGSEDLRTVAERQQNKGERRNATHFASAVSRPKRNARFNESRLKVDERLRASARTPEAA